MPHHHQRIFRGLAALVAGTTLWGAGLAGTASATPAPAAPAPAQQARHVSMPDGSTVLVSPNGFARRVSAQGKLIGETMLPVSAGRSALGDSWTPSDEAVRTRFQQLAADTKPTDVLAVLSGGTAVTGAPVTGKATTGRRAAVTSNSSVNAAFATLHADSVSPLFATTPATEVQQWTAAAQSRLGAKAVDLSRVVVVHLHGGDATKAANALKTTSGIAYAEPDVAATTLNTPSKPLPSWAGRNATAKADDPALPSNYGLASSLQSFLNAGGVNAEGAYSELTSKYGQLPGTGEIITNVSIGDIIDSGMTDQYAKLVGPTTIVQNGQHYLDMPSEPLIPTYVADASGNLSGSATAESEDPSLGEVGLDFSVMSPLPHAQQRAGSVGSGVTDLLGIAPGAQYRLVVPSTPTFAQIETSLMAAATQNPRPNVITASLGFGTDGAGFPGRYLEDDPVAQAVVAAIVQEYHVVVCISANDGTRLFTPTAVGPDGGSTPTNVTTDPNATTNINDVQASTTPSRVLDSGAIDVGASTLDDTLSVPTDTNAPGAHNGTWATVRPNGVGEFSSGMGTRVNVSAPGDGIPALTHTIGGGPGDVDTGLSGGTSASSPETAAAAAVVLQAARLTGQSLDPEQVRSLLARTGRPVPTPPQMDTTVNVGNQIDLTAAVNSVLHSPAAHPQIVRVSVAHRQVVGNLGGDYTENTDPSLVDLAGPSGTGEGLVGPVTIGADVTGLPAHGEADYVLRINGHEFHSATPSIRLTPTELLTAAGQPVVATANRTIDYTFQVREHGQVVASVDKQLTFSATDGTYAEAQAPVVPATTQQGRPVTVHYDLTGVRGVHSPQLVVSTAGHWNPALGPIFTAADTVPLTATKGTVTVPASAFDDGGALYGIGIVQDSTGAQPVYGEFASIRVAGGTAAQRPAAPALAVAGGTQYGHNLEINRTTPVFSVNYDVRGVPGAKGTAIELASPSPDLFGSQNTVTNMNGTQRDNDRVDSGSVVFQPLPGTSGTQQLNVDTLKLLGSVGYDVRVFATDAAGHVIGQASPTSYLTLDDGLTQNGDMVDTFAVVPGGQSVVTLRSQIGQPDTLRLYDTATGTYGAILATGATTNDGYSIVGVDPSSHHVLVNHWQFMSTSFALEVYDTSTAKLVSSVSETGSYTAVGGRVDPTRHRGDVLVHRDSDNADMVLPVDMATGQVGTAVPADAPGVAAGTYGLIDVDQTTGAVLLAKADDNNNCAASGPGLVAGVNLDTGTITPATTADGCADRIAIDQGTGTLYQLSAHADQFEDGYGGPTSLIPTPTSTLKAGPPIPVRQLEGEALAVDSVHHLALVPFVQQDATPLPSDLPSDNNATSEIAVVDLTTGKEVSTVRGFNFGWGFLNFSGYDAPAEQQIELDPTTRTGWTYAWNGQQLQQFSY